MERSNPAETHFRMPQDHQDDATGTCWEAHNHLWAQAGDKRGTLENRSSIRTELPSLTAQSHGLCITDVSQQFWS